MPTSAGVRIRAIACQRQEPKIPRHMDPKITIYLALRSLLFGDYCKARPNAKLLVTGRGTLIAGSDRGVLICISAAPAPAEQSICSRLSQCHALSVGKGGWLSPLLLRVSLPTFSHRNDIGFEKRWCKYCTATLEACGIRVV